MRLQGGKRLRPGFLTWGHVAAGGSADEATLQAATAMEFFQAAALLHDDVMDDSDTRRGTPAAHRVWAQRHREHAFEGSPEDHGIAGAILAGDLCLVWADAAFTGCGWEPEQMLRPEVIQQGRVGAGRRVQAHQQRGPIVDGPVPVPDKDVRVVRHEQVTDSRLAGSASVARFVGPAGVRGQQVPEFPPAVRCDTTRPPRGGQ